VASRLRGHSSTHRRRAHTYVQWPFSPPGTGTFSRPYFQLIHAIIVCFLLYYILIIQGDLSTRRFQTAGLSVSGDRYSFLVHSAYVPAYFDTTTEEHLGWDQMEFCDVLVTLDSPQHTEEVGASQFTQAPPVWTQPTQPQAPGAGGATPDDAGSSQAAMATPSLDQLGPWVVRAPDPWTYDRDQTWAGARAVRAKRGRRI
jgi:hypothetical protein